MKKSATVKSALFLFTTFCCMALNLGESEAANWVQNLSVSRVAVHDDCFIIETNSGLSNCPVPGRFVVLANASNAKEIYATALTAFLTGKLIDIYYDTSHPCRKGGIISFLIEIHS